MNDALLHIQNVCLSYGERHVLCHINECVVPHDCIVLSGPNGGGKTTLLRLMAGLLSPTAGHIERRKGITVGYLPQYRHIDRHFPTTVFDIVRSGLACRKRFWQRYNETHHSRVKEMLHLFHLEDLADRPISDLSGGQWQRTLLARAMVSQPDLLLLDEPETHLDEPSREELYHILRRWSERCAMVVVSHNVDHFPEIAGRRIWHVEERCVREI